MNKLALIAAVARNGAIGRNNGLLWREPLDQKHFRAVTMGCPVVMGRKTWDSLPERFRPLPGRRNVVVTHNPEFAAVGAETASSLAAALSLVHDADKVFVIGGGQLYAEALPLVDEMVLTEVEADLAGDTHFPAWDRAAFDETAQEHHVGADGTAFAFVTYARRPPAGD